MSAESIRILVVEDSALYRQLIKNVLRDVPNTEVVGVAKSGPEALTLIEELTPDLLTLDVQMPGMTGIEVLRELKNRRSRAKAIMLSSLTMEGAQITTDALLEGAFDFIPKPSGPDAATNRNQLAASLAEKIQGFADSFGGQFARDKPVALRSTSEDEDDQPTTRYEALLIGTSTGGPVALREVLPALPKDLSVPVLIVQHMPAQYTQPLAQRLNEASEITVVEAQDGMVLEAGTAYLAPGGRQMKVTMRAGRPIVRINDDPPENSCRPAVDYLFRSAAEVFGGKVVAAILTGMGRDGVEGCRALKRLGAFIIAQHSDGCVVYGMPKAVADEGLADRILTLDRITPAIVRRVRRSAR